MALTLGSTLPLALTTMPINYDMHHPSLAIVAGLL
nr:MAG TPA: hypothetical protein [Caudoviricetes sp.]